MMSLFSSVEIILWRRSFFQAIYRCRISESSIIAKAESQIIRRLKEIVGSFVTEVLPSTPMIESSCQTFLDLSCMFVYPVCGRIQNTAFSIEFH